MFELKNKHCVACTNSYKDNLIYMHNDIYEQMSCASYPSVVPFAEVT